MKFGPIARGATAFFCGIALVVVVLGYQHAHHGWPFSLHHGLAPIASAPRTTNAPAPSHAGHRVPVRVPSETLARFGIRTETLREMPLASELRAVATIVPDEARVSHVHTRVSGWIERLSVRTTGESVRAGQTLAAIFSQELLASQSEYLAVRRSTPVGTESPLVRGARERLRVLGMTDGEIGALERRGTPSRTVEILAPRTGTVIHRGVTVGAAVDPSTELFTVVDFSHVWVLAEVPEARASDVNVGSTASVEIPGTGEAAIELRVEFVYPTLTEGTRTLRVRFDADNPEGKLRPGMFGTATFHVAPRTGWAVARDAIVDTGTAQHVFVESSPGYFEPRTVRVGARTDDTVEILSGLEAGDRVVSSGVFMLDSESRLRASGSAGGHAGHGAPSPAREGRGSPDEPPNRGDSTSPHAGHRD